VFLESKWIISERASERASEREGERKTKNRELRVNKGLHRILRRVFTEGKPTEFLEAVHNRHLLIIYSFAEQMNDLFETVMTPREPKAKPFQMFNELFGNDELEDKEEKEEEDEDSLLLFQLRKLTGTSSTTQDQTEWCLTLF
jgi:hypothetical protein